MIRIAATILVVLLLAPAASAQRGEQAEAEQRLRELQVQIQRYEEQLIVARSDETRAVEALDTIDREIATREALIDSYDDRLTELNQETVAIENEMERARRELNRLRDEYARYAREAYVRGRIGDLALILSAGSINQMLVRARHLQRIAGHRQRAAEQIVETQNELQSRRAELDSTAADIESLLAASRIEQGQLESRHRERTQMVSQLRRQRSTIQAEMERRENEAAQLRTRIADMIAEVEAERRRAAEAELRRAEEAAAAAAAASAASPTAPAPRAPTAPAPAPEVSEAEFARLSGDFRSNRGRIPWPVSGVVTEPFGPRRNEVTGTVIPNPGMVISSSPLTPVRAVFTGSVARIFVNPGYGTCVLLSHGDFATTYCNLSSVDVSTGGRIEAGAVVGRSGSQEQPLGAGIFFGIFEQGRDLNPADWLLRQ